MVWGWQVPNWIRSARECAFPVTVSTPVEGCCSVEIFQRRLCGSTVQSELMTAERPFCMASSMNMKAPLHPAVLLHLEYSHIPEQTVRGAVAVGERGSASSACRQTDRGSREPGRSQPEVKGTENARLWTVSSIHTAKMLCSLTTVRMDSCMLLRRIAKMACACDRSDQGGRLRMVCAWQVSGWSGSDS